MAFWSKPNPAHHPVINTPAKKAGWIAVAVTIVGAFEGLYLHPYYDSVGVRTVCYGATAADGVDLHRTYTKQECQDMLARDLPKYDAQVKKCLTPEVYNALPSSRHAAVVSLTYNIGGGAFCKSSVARDLNSGHIQQACDDFLKFNRGGGRVIKGLTNRRQQERVLCLRND